MMMMISRTKATGFNIHVLLFFTICKCLWSDFLLPCTLAHKDCWQSGGGDPMWQASPYLAIGEDNGYCHRSWQAVKCNFCSILHSGSTLHPRSSAAAPSSQSHPFANFFSPKNRAGKQDDSPYHTLRHRGFHQRGVFQEGSKKHEVTVGNNAC